MSHRAPRHLPCGARVFLHNRLRAGGRGAETLGMCEQAGEILSRPFQGGKNINKLWRMCALGNLGEFGQDATSGYASFDK
jgi:hypothetical protein